MKGKVFGIILASALIVSACKTASVAQVSKADIRKVVNSSDVTLVDVRIPEQYQEGTAKKAINIPLSEIEKNIDFLKKQKQIVVFCNKGIQADKALEVLKKNGIENAYDGTSWKNVKAIQDEKATIQ